MIGYEGVGGEEEVGDGFVNEGVSEEEVEGWVGGGRVEVEGLVGGDEVREDVVSDFSG